MKRIFTYLTGFSLLAITTISCSKEGHDEMGQQAAAPQVIAAAVPAGQTYVFDLGAGSAASIQKQARHYQLSEIATAPGGNTVYRYTALKGYAGADEVTLQQTVTSTAQSGGCYYGNTNGYTTTAFKTIVLKFNVGN